MRLKFLVAALLISSACSIPVPAASASEALISNAEMKAIFDADQAPRKSTVTPMDWSAIGAQDRARQTRTRQLLASGALKTGDDYYHAAMVFQHGNAADDHLLAHALSVAAAARGRGNAAWLAAATLDRYLQTIGRPQIYGTQYETPQPPEEMTQEPYNRALIPDALRTALNVPTQAEQETMRQDILAARRAASEAKK